MIYLGRFIVRGQAVLHQKGARNGYSALAKRPVVNSDPAAWHSRMIILCARELPRGSGLCQDMSVNGLLLAVHVLHGMCTVLCMPTSAPHAGCHE
jgi:hypothetical protein